MKCYRLRSAASEHNARSANAGGTDVGWKQPPFWEMYFIILCDFRSRGTVGQWRKTFRLPWKFDCSLQTIQHKIGDILLTQQHQCLKETVGNVKFMVLWVIGGRFPSPPPTPLQQASVKNRASRKFLATSQQSRRKLYPTLPLGLNEIYSLWASFNLVFQIAKPVKEGS